MSIRLGLHRLGVHQGEDDLEATCGLLDIDDGGKTRRLMVDCGSIPQSASAPNFSVLADGRKIDGIFVTHVHGDHIGNLPAAVPYLAPGAGIYLTKTSAAVLAFILEDSHRIGAKSGGPQPFTEDQMREALSRLRIIDRPGVHEPLSGLETLVYPAGHINGACSYSFRVGGKIVHYSGDRCGHAQTGIRGAPALPADWRPHIIAGSDCTYGSDPDSDRRDWHAEMDRGVLLAADALRQKRPVMFYAFGLHRGPVVAHELRRHGLGDLGWIVLDGAVRHFAKVASDPSVAWCDLDEKLETEDLRFIEGGRHRWETWKSGHGMAVVTTPGMGGPHGAATFWRKQMLSDPDALMIFTSYVAPGTDGDKILKADAERKRTGRIQHIAFIEEDRQGVATRVVRPLRCQVERIRIGSHDSQGKIVDWFRSYAPEVAVLSHGSRTSLARIETALASDIPHIVRADRTPTIELHL